LKFSDFLFIFYNRKYQLNVHMLYGKVGKARECAIDAVVLFAKSERIY